MRQLSKSDSDLILDAKAEGLTELPEDVLEKDLHLSYILRELAVSEISKDLVFCGGTALAKAHQIINRMSEDVDFKFVPEAGQSKNQTKNAAKAVSEVIRNIVTTLGFEVQEQSENNGNHRVLAITYLPAFPRVTSLRQEIKLETTTSTPVLPAAKKKLRTLLFDAAGREDFDTQLNCLSIEETLLEKVSVFLRKNHKSNRVHFESTLIRHVYDCACLMEKVQIDQRTIHAFKLILKQDAIHYPKQLPEQESEIPEFLTASKRDFVANSEMKNIFATFVSDLLIGEGKNFEEVRSSFESLASQLISGLK